MTLSRVGTEPFVKLIAGLGNPGREYANTPHNVGFAVTDLLCERLDGSWHLEPRFKGRVARVTHAGESVLLVQPQTFMNASGDCVGAIANYFRIEPDDLMAVLDDVELPPGRLRIRPQGGDGGHRGLASLIMEFGTDRFVRVRIGVGRGAHASQGQSLVGHVLGRLPPEAQEAVDRVLPVAADALLETIRSGASVAMNKYNGYGVEAAHETATPAEGSDGVLVPEEQGTSHVEKV